MMVPNCGACSLCGEVPHVIEIREHIAAGAASQYLATVACLAHGQRFEGLSPAKEAAVAEAARRWSEQQTRLPPRP